MGDVAATPARVRSDPQADLRTASLAHKTELLGQIAAAIAHQFNTVMMAVSSYAEVELKKAAPSQRRCLEQVLGNVAQATFLTGKLLSLGRARTPSPQALSLNSLLTGTQVLLQQLAGDHVEVVLSLDPGIQVIKADQIEMEQLILSLVINARNGLADSGKIMISTDSVELDSAFLESDDSAKPGRYMVLSVSDSGAGAGKQPHHRKSQGKDTVIPANPNLAAVRGIVRDAGGLIRFSVSSTTGACRKIYFPAVSLAASKVRDLDMVPKTPPVSRTILVVEDEDAVRVPAAEFLKMEGFKVPASEEWNRGSSNGGAAQHTSGPARDRYCDARAKWRGACGAVTGDVPGPQDPLHVGRPGQKASIIAGGFRERNSTEALPPQHIERQDPRTARTVRPLHRS